MTKGQRLILAWTGTAIGAAMAVGSITGIIISIIRQLS